MKADILNEVVIFLFFLLTILSSFPGVAQRNYNRIGSDTRIVGVEERSTRVLNHSYYNRGFRDIHRAGFNLNYSNGIVTNPNCLPRSKQLVVRPSRNNHGLRFLPANSMRFSVRGVNYFHTRGTFFIYTPRGYQAAQAPIGAIAKHLPVQATEFYYNGFVYYRVENLILSSMYDRRGSVVYQLVGFV